MSWWAGVALASTLMSCSRPASPGSAWAAVSLVRALGFVRAAAREMRDQGTMEFAAEQIGQGELNEMFARAQES